MFPQRLAQRVAAHGRGEAGPTIPSVHAQWFFDERLTFWIDPGRLTRRLHDRVSLRGADIWLSDRFVDPGDWSEVIRPVHQLAEHRDMIELVSYGARYPDMPVFRELSDRIGTGRPARRYGQLLNTEEKLHRYFRYFLQLVESIRENGFQEQGRLSAAGPAKGTDARGKKFAGRQRNIGVAIAADGEVLRFLGGRHRTAIAQALLLPAVPVEIRLVQDDWLAKQVEVAGKAPVEALLHWTRSQRADPWSRSTVGPGGFRTG